MCFSVEADLVVGVALLPVGAVSLREVRHWREVPFAALPLLFALHQLAEALVWAGTDGDVSSGTARAAATAYAVFALPVLPLLMPVAVLLLEPRGARLRVVPFVVLGAVVATYLAVTLVRHGVDVTVHPYGLQYAVGLSQAGVWTVLYIVAGVGAALISGYRSIVAFGVANLVGLTVVALVYQDAFASLWCIWAGISSVLICVHMVRRRWLPDAERLTGRLRPVPAAR